MGWGGEALPKQPAQSHFPHQFLDKELLCRRGKGTRTCFELGNGAEECGGPFGAGIDEADGVVAVVESRLAEGAEQLVVVAAVLSDAAGRVVDADLLILVLGAGVHENVVLHGHVRMEGLEAVVAQVETAGDAALVGNAPVAADLADDGPGGAVEAPLEVAVLLHVALGEPPAQVVLGQLHLVAVGHAVRAAAHGADEDEEVLCDLGVFLQLPQALLAQAVVAGQHEGVQAQPAAHGAGEMVHQVAVRRCGLHFIHLGVAGPDAQRGLGAGRRSRRGESFRRHAPELTRKNWGSLQGRPVDGREHRLWARAPHRVLKAPPLFF